MIVPWQNSAIKLKTIQKSEIITAKLTFTVQGTY